MSTTGLKNLTKKALTSFLTAAPENTAFISSWSALDAAIAGESPQGIADEAMRGGRMGWRLRLDFRRLLLSPKPRNSEWLSKRPLQMSVEDFLG